MWLLFHRRGKTRAVRGGETFVQSCPECRATARFVEVEVTEKYGLWFVDVAGNTSRAYLCTACEEVFDAQDDAAAPRQIATAPAAALPPAKSAKEREIEQIKAELERRKQARVKETRIEDELAELKKRLGR